MFTCYDAGVLLAAAGVCEVYEKTAWLDYFLNQWTSYEACCNMQQACGNGNTHLFTRLLNTVVRKLNSAQIKHEDVRSKAHLLDLVPPAVIAHVHPHRVAVLHLPSVLVVCEVGLRLGWLGVVVKVVRMVVVWVVVEVIVKVVGPFACCGQAYLLIEVVEGGGIVVDILNMNILSRCATCAPLAEPSNHDPTTSELYRRPHSQKCTE